MQLKRAIIVLGITILLSACASPSPPLTTWSGVSSSANMHNLEGIKHYQMGHWKVAKGHFEEAIQAEPNVAEPHYNLALALHQLGSHKQATVHFKKAAELAPDNPAITQSPVYKKHVAPRGDYLGA